MKFGKELDEASVPEWKDKYLDYDGGKKKLKAVARAMRNFDDGDSPKESRKSPFASLRDAPVYSFLQRGRQDPTPSGARPGASRESDSPLMHIRSKSEAPSPAWAAQQGSTTPDRTPKARAMNESSPLTIKRSNTGGPRMTRYGSIIGSPPRDEENPAMARLGQAPTLELPEPAIEDEDPEDDDYDRPVSPGSPEIKTNEAMPKPPMTQLAHTGNAYEITKPTDNPNLSNRSLLAEHYQDIFRPRRTNSTPDASRPFMRRMFSTAPANMPKNVDVALEAYREVDFRKAEFFLFLDKELAKIETFYQLKEDEATERLKVLREQLHIMRDRRLDEVTAAEQRKAHPPATPSGDVANGNGKVSLDFAPDGNDGAADFLQARSRLSQTVATSVDFTRGAFDSALGRVRTGHVGKTTRKMGELGTPNWGTNEDAINATGNVHDPRQDYTRRNPHNVIPYRTAKRKLKVAMAEFYRGLELLKSYALLNRKAFRKINKKFDKATSAQPKLRYVNEKVEGKAYFVTSDVVDRHLTAVEDLYSRYFERGNHKVAVSKLRAKSAKAGDYYGAVLRTGLLLSAGTVLGIQGMALGATRLWGANEPPGRAEQTSYLLQIYAGYFLMLFLTFLFCLDAAVFSNYKVNYQFIFEFDVRHMLDWQQLSEIPAWFLLLLGLMMWCNFNVWGGEVMYIYWPVILIGLSAALILCPPPLFYPRSRAWFLQSNGRLLAAGLFPVEFRDFFLGDMFCSLTYALGNLELFFCLYAHHWKNPPQCNSSHSMLLGFFSTLPGIWRLLQCFRRFYDTANAIPHLLNGGKYSCTILQYVSLSLFRIYKHPGLLAFFIVSATVNSIYCSLWDLFYDWSMPLSPYSRPYPFLRSILAYRRHVWWYYVAMVLDPILRFNWIFYVIFKDDVQHSSLISFLVAFSEVVRRGIWVVFRVENEHCSNVGRFRAQRDPALPYALEKEDEVITDRLHAATHPVDNVVEPGQMDGTHGTPSGRDVEQGSAETAASSLRRRTTRQQALTIESPVYRALRRAGSTMLAAHAQDYERRRPKVTEGTGGGDSDSE